MWDKNQGYKSTAASCAHSVTETLRHDSNPFNSICTALRSSCKVRIKKYEVRETKFDTVSLFRSNSEGLWSICSDRKASGPLCTHWFYCNKATCTRQHLKWASFSFQWKPKKKKKKKKKKKEKKIKDKSYNRECQLQIKPYSFCWFSHWVAGLKSSSGENFILSVTLNRKDVC